jgi:hypothetical protein
MLPLLFAALVAPATVVYRPLSPAGAELAAPAPAATAGSEFACDDGSNGGTLVEHTEAYYGNRFATDCAAGRVLGVRFTHFGYGLQGNYAFRVHLFDAACAEVAVSDVRTIPGAPDALASVEVNLSNLGWCVSSEFSLMLEPLSCADGAAGHDCFPAVVVDASNDAEEPAHCAMVNAPTAEGRQCLAARSADGRYFDFRLRALVACSDPACATAVVPGTWTQIKRLYRDASDRTRD